MILILSADWADDVDLSTERVLRAFFMCICGLGNCQLSEDELLRALSEKSRLLFTTLSVIQRSMATKNLGSTAQPFHVDVYRSFAGAQDDIPFSLSF